jgi:hypothetical protein
MAGPLRTVEVAEPVRSALSLFSGDRLPGGGLSRRWTSAFSGASRRASAFMPIEIGLLRRLCAKRRPSLTRRVSFRSAQADRWPKALAPIEIGLLAALARQASAFADARDVFSVGVGRPMAEGLGAD